MNMNPKSSKPVLICAFGLLAAFFMPWVQLFGVGISGYNLGRLGSYWNYAWVIPILAGATILFTFSGYNNREIDAIAGIVSLGVILYGMEVVVIEVHVLSIGAWLTIIFSIAIIIAALVGNRDHLIGKIKE